MIHFLADVHLHPEGNGASNRSFRTYLGQPPPARLFILGDLFEVWAEHASLAMTSLYKEELAGLRQWRERGCEIIFLPGNRDFLANGLFETATGGVVRGDEEKLILGEYVIWMEHGDRFCGRDISYQRWRAFARSRVSRAVFAALPGRAASWLLKRLRDGSAREIERKTAYQMRLDPETMQKRVPSDVTTVICGHVHCGERFSLRDGVTVYSLPAWGTRGGYLSHHEGQWKMCSVAPGGENGTGGGELS